MTPEELKERIANYKFPDPEHEPGWRKQPNGVWTRIDYSFAVEPGSPEDEAYKREWERATAAILMDWARTHGAYVKQNKEVI